MLPNADAIAHPIFRHATLFEVAAQTLLKKSETADRGIMVAYANLAFCIELYLKSLIVIDTGHNLRNTHKFNILVRRLSISTQKELEVGYNNLYDQQMKNLILQLEAENFEQELIVKLKNSKSFYWYLESCGDVYVALRYLYEGSKLYFFPDLLIPPIKEAIRTRRPAWF